MSTPLGQKEEEKGEVFICPCNISCKELDKERCSLLCWWWLTYLRGVHFTLSYILSRGAVSDVAARQGATGEAAKCLCAFSLWKEMPGCRLGSDHPAGPDILSPHTFILSRPHVLNSQWVGTKEGAMAWSNTAVWYCGETSCNSLCQSARGSCFQAEEAVIHNEQRKLFCV